MFYSGLLMIKKRFICFPKYAFIFNKDGRSDRKALFRVQKRYYYSKKGISDVS